jgi:hypothetical protein
MTGSIPTHVMTSPPPTQSMATSIPTNTQTSRAPGRARGNKLSVAVLGILSLIGILPISS